MKLLSEPINKLLETIYLENFIFNKVGYLYKCSHNSRKIAKLQDFNSNKKCPSSQAFQEFRPGYGKAVL